MEAWEQVRLQDDSGREWERIGMSGGGDYHFSFRRAAGTGPPATLLLPLLTETRGISLFFEFKDVSGDDPVTVEVTDGWKVDRALRRSRPIRPLLTGPIQ